MTNVVASNQTILVVGGGISGMTAALEAAECGKPVVLVEKTPSVGGHVSQLTGMASRLEINLRRIKANKNLQVLTLSEVEKIEGKAGDYRATIRIKPRHVNANCTACGDCAQHVKTEFDNEYDYGLSLRKGVYLPHRMAYPQRYVIDPRVIGTPDADAVNKACKYDAVELDAVEKIVALDVAAVIWATGWKPYDANKIQPYGYDRYENVITSVEFERMADPTGPTGGKLIRPSDGKPAKKVAFIQCAGSRDRNHLRHCSSICCTASLKQTTYLDEAFGDEANISVYYLDIRTAGGFDAIYNKVRANKNVKFIRSKVASIAQGKDNNPVLQGVDTEGYHRYSNSYDLVVLAIGMEPSVPKGAFPVAVKCNVDGFIENDLANGGVFAAGCSAEAVDVNTAVQSATASALRAIQIVNRVASAEMEATFGGKSGAKFEFGAGA